jgi:hypothetical protein
VRPQLRPHDSNGLIRYLIGMDLVQVVDSFTTRIKAPSLRSGAARRRASRRLLFPPRLRLGPRRAHRRQDVRELLDEKPASRADHGEGKSIGRRRDAGTRQLEPVRPRRTRSPQDALALPDPYLPSARGPARQHPRDTGQAAAGTAHETDKDTHSRSAARDPRQEQHRPGPEPSRPTAPGRTRERLRRQPSSEIGEDQTGREGAGRGGEGGRPWERPAAVR